MEKGISKNSKKSSGKTRRPSRRSGISPLMLILSCVITCVLSITVSVSIVKSQMKTMVVPQESAITNTQLADAITVAFQTLDDAQKEVIRQALDLRTSENYMRPQNNTQKGLNPLIFMVVVIILCGCALIGFVLFHQKHAKKNITSIKTTKRKDPFPHKLKSVEVEQEITRFESPTIPEIKNQAEEYQPTVVTENNKPEDQPLKNVAQKVLDCFRNPSLLDATELRDVSYLKADDEQIELSLNRGIQKFYVTNSQYRDSALFIQEKNLLYPNIYSLDFSPELELDFLGKGKVTWVFDFALDSEQNRIISLNTLKNSGKKYRILDFKPAVLEEKNVIQKGLLVLKEH